MGRLLWIITALFIMAATHISYVLFMPGYLFERKLTAMSVGKAENAFFILPQDQQAKIFPTAMADDVVGVCKFDLSSKHVVLSAQLPRSYWTLSIYTASGKQIYSLDDVQAGSNSFTVDLTRAKTMLQQLFAKSDTEETGQIENLGWKVETTERRGIAVVWIPLGDEMMRAETENIIKGSHCEAKAVQQ